MSITPLIASATSPCSLAYFASVVTSNIALCGGILLIAAAALYQIRSNLKNLEIASFKLRDANVRIQSLKNKQQYMIPGYLCAFCQWVKSQSFENKEKAIESILIRKSNHTLTVQATLEKLQIAPEERIIYVTIGDGNANPLQRFPQMLLRKLGKEPIFYLRFENFTPFPYFYSPADSNFLGKYFLSQGAQETHVANSTWVDSRFPWPAGKTFSDELQKKQYPFTEKLWNKAREETFKATFSKWLTESLEANKVIHLGWHCCIGWVCEFLLDCYNKNQPTHPNQIFFHLGCSNAYITFDKPIKAEDLSDLTNRFPDIKSQLANLAFLWGKNPVIREPGHIISPFGFNQSTPFLLTQEV